MAFKNQSKLLEKAVVAKVDDEEVPEPEPESQLVIDVEQDDESEIDVDAETDEEEDTTNMDAQLPTTSKVPKKETISHPKSASVRPPTPITSTSVPNQVSRDRTIEVAAKVSAALVKEKAKMKPTIKFISKDEILINGFESEIAPNLHIKPYLKKFQANYAVGRAALLDECVVEWLRVGWRLILRP